MEQRHLHERHQLAKSQLKETFFLQRSQMLNRHQKVRTLKVFFDLALSFPTVINFKFSPSPIEGRAEIDDGGGGGGGEKEDGRVVRRDTARVVVA